MSAIHEQAMNYVYQQVLQRMIGHFTRAERTVLQLLVQRIVVAAGGMEQVGHYKVLITHGGGEVSSYTLAMLRAAQLTIAGRAPKTFHLRVATLRYAGMTQATLDNLNQGYSALFFHDDPRVELLMVENRDVQPFNPQRPASSVGREVSQRNMLLLGHLTSGDIRATLCNDTYLAFGEFYQCVATWNGGVHAMVSGDSPRKQSQYLAWLKKTALATGLDFARGKPMSLNRLFARMEEWSIACYRDLYGEHYVGTEELGRGGYRHLAYIGIADLLDDVDVSRSTLLTDFLAHKQDPFDFHFSHPAAPNPLLMAHLHGLQAQCLRELSYEHGVESFIRQAMDYMRRRKIPNALIAEASSEDGRILSTTYAQEFFGLDEGQLTCLLFAPFIEHGERLEGFLRQCHPGMLVALPELHKALQGKPAPDMLQQWLVDTSGLPLPILQHVYRKRPLQVERGILARKPRFTQSEAPTARLSGR
ncbi:hypothetical protein [Pseudomonas synxantha]|uniref:Uncharacterized protein n=1 Tax=Pseudomonas synxantha TaxID=47883 RepID=A0AAX3I7V8_9PSED|nr:hypothetical protein [Pseudomonas synxantha]AZE67055.1 hypothetical protein C4K01_2860 [Pseudomonas synxantha]MBI6566628.1 hypothetical protein [Pseudomonas synxantha]MBI6579705.1 hypothetical protein [Pseudomonas synxantha]MBI6645198.1 hypothetical protein [Pseudomonas synxantha]MDQ0981091.1 hypothetical protein [Pseudomonas synxantha]